MKKKKLEIEVVKMDCKTGATTYEMKNVFPTRESIELAWEARQRYVDTWQMFPTLEDFVAVWEGYSLEWLRDGFGKHWINFFYNEWMESIVEIVKKRRVALKANNREVVKKYEDLLHKNGIAIKDMDFSLDGKPVAGVDCELLKTDNEHQIQGFPIYECHADGTPWIEDTH